MIPPNPQIDCGNDPACFGGVDCDFCPDGMPPAFMLSGSLQNDTCTQCETLDGLVLPQGGGCQYRVESWACYGEPVILAFESSMVSVIRLTASGPGLSAVVYESAYAVGVTRCNQAHTLTKVLDDWDACDWPDEITVAPCDASGNVAPACNDTVTTDCCPAIPKVLVATITPLHADCDCADGEVIDLSWDDTRWTGSGTICGNSWTVELRCTSGGDSADDLAMRIPCGDATWHGATGSPTCSPLSATFEWTSESSCCDGMGAFSVTVTE